jgi:hypothetical protein
MQEVALEEGFSARVRALSSATVLHIPVEQRQRHAVILTGLLNRINEDDLQACVLEEARSKLLLSPPPRGTNIRVELAKRLQLWVDGAFEELLSRAEGQARDRARRNALLQGAPKHGARARRARALIAEGAFSKAASSLHTEVAILDAEKQVTWGRTLLPGSARPAAARSVAPAAADGGEAAGDAQAQAASALQGVRFRAMSAAGPSGARAEHLRELVAVRDRRCANALLCAIGKFVDVATSGRLCDAARWTLDSRLVFLRKKSGVVPRPIRVGELWRRVVAKRLVDSCREDVQQACLVARQFGVAIPGGAEGLIHFRTLLERSLAASEGAMVVIDVDFKNAFPSLEWDSIREAVDEALPQASAWTHWCHQEPGRVILPSGDELRIDRGAEQGDPMGPIYCALVLARVAARARAACSAQGTEFFDAWYLDDGQLICRPSHADAVLRALDFEAGRVGAVRAAGTEAKSVARLLGSGGAAHPQWKTERIKDTTSEDPARQQHVLGVDFGAVAMQFEAATEQVAELHEALALVEDTACEMILLRKCADVCKVVHLLRAAGPSIGEDALKSYDALLGRSLQRCLGRLDDLSLRQACLGVADGGLGMRRAAATALPAYVACRVECRWLVQLLADGMAECGLAPAGLLNSFDAETTRAQMQLQAALPASGAEQVRVLVAQAAAARRTPEAALQRRRRARESALTGDGLVLPAGCEDPEFQPESLQGSLQAVCDRDGASSLLDDLGALGLHDRRRHVVELRDPSVSHDWLWRVSPAHGPTVGRGEFQDGVRIRLGAPLGKPGAECSRCRCALGGNSHGLLCARPEATRGHYEVRDTVLELAHLADPSADVETVGLIPSVPTLRPADILTSAALPGRLAALDIGITSPDATGAGGDCCEAMHRRKLGTYRPHFAELQEGGVVYKPLVWSAFGRAHPETTVVLEALAKQAARRRGLRDHRLVLRRARAAIGVKLVQRAVRMVRACLTEAADEDLNGLFGHGAAPELRKVVLLHGGEAEAEALEAAQVAPAGGDDDDGADGEAAVAAAAAVLAAGGGGGGAEQLP